MLIIKFLPELAMDNKRYIVTRMRAEASTGNVEIEPWMLARMGLACGQAYKKAREGANVLVNYIHSQLIHTSARLRSELNTCLFKILPPP